jgi:ADP-heptose:LPS heptosyltransferase
MYSQCMPTISRLHATEIIGQMLNVPIDDRLLDIFLTQAEEARARETMRAFHNPVVIQVTSRCSENKNWLPERWEALVSRNPQYPFVQLGVAEEPAISGAIDLRGKTSIRESLALLKYASAFVGVESFLAHAANALGTPGVVLFGPTPADVWGHRNSTIVTKGLRCAPCSDLLRGTPCPYGRPCMTTIPVEEVELALRQRRRKEQ